MIVDLTEKMSFFLQRKPISQFLLDSLFNFCRLEQWQQPWPGDP